MSTATRPKDDILWQAQCAVAPYDPAAFSADDDEMLVALLKWNDALHVERLHADLDGEDVFRIRTFITIEDIQAVWDDLGLTPPTPAEIVVEWEKHFPDYPRVKLKVSGRMTMCVLGARMSEVE